MLKLCIIASALFLGCTNGACLKHNKNNIDGCSRDCMKIQGTFCQFNCIKKFCPK